MYRFSWFWKSETGSTTIDLQVENAAFAYTYLNKLEGIDALRIGVIDFSLGGGVANLLATKAERYKSMVTWSSVGDFTKDMMGTVGQEAFSCR